MSMYRTCPCGIPEGLDQVHLRSDCPHYGEIPPMTNNPTQVEPVEASTLADEPVAWMYEHPSDGKYASVRRFLHPGWTGTPLYAAPPASVDRNTVLEEALSTAAETLFWAARRMKECHCVGSDIDAVNLAGDNARRALRTTEAPAQGGE